MAIAIAALACGSLLAQGALATLGLTDTAARTFLLNELKAPARDRRAAIAVAGTRAFYKLPPAARGSAATGLFAWAKAHVNSPAFAAAYAEHRRGLIPQGPQYAQTVDEVVKKEIDDMLAGIEQIRQAAASMPPADRDKILQSIKEQEANLRDPVFLRTLRERHAAERAERAAGDTALGQTANEAYPADPQQLVARRLREFLEATADADFSARTISLTGGADGIEFVEPADRERSFLWQLAVIAGREATTAAREAAEAWLKEIDR